ncbi:MAG: lipid-A-disaccharide synthase [Bacteroidota bacterium]
MKYYIIAGEASGDLHGSNLIKAIAKQDPDASIRCWGGDLMEAAGGHLVKHYRDLAFMGFIEVVKNLPAIIKNIAFCKEDIISFSPDVIILIDYPGFNLRIAKWAKKNHFKVIYYISPQVWAWKENRVRMMKKCIDKMLVILPFEADYYKNKWHWDVEYVGHPLLEAVAEFKDSNIENLSYNKPVIALLPGSRKQEIAVKLPIMLGQANLFKDFQFVIAKAPGIEASFYDHMIGDYKNVDYVANQTYALLNKSVAALVTSGTATLETALFGVPQVVCYKGNKISYEIAKRVIKVSYISLVNLIMGKMVVKELIQDELNAANLTNELTLILPDGAKRSQVLKDYEQLKSVLQSTEGASARAAKIILDFLRS